MLISVVGEEEEEEEEAWIERLKGFLGWWRGQKREGGERVWKVGFHGRSNPLIFLTSEDINFFSFYPSASVF